MDRNKFKNISIIILYVVLIGLIVSAWITGRAKLRAIESRFNQWDKLSLILSQLDKNYVDSIDVDAITERAIPFILSELDPHSVYLPPEERQKADESLSGNFYGIGIQFNVPEDTAVVIQVIPGGPSERAGLMAGDRIVSVDGRNVAGVRIDQDTLVSIMKGPLGSNVRIGILRDGENVDFDIERGVIPVKSVDVAYMIDDTTAYVKLSKFTRTSYIEFMAAMHSLDTSAVKRIIFDVRDNTGGYLDQAYLLANEFLDKDQTVVYMEGRHRKREDLLADGSGHFKNVELAVLINENSASSSEIFAGAMQDNDRAIIYGRRSFGKGLVQEPINFTDKSGLRLTVARFYTPTGRCIQKPYEPEDMSYAIDILERYRHGEMTVADSIKKNDSLRYVTPGGRVVYGGGGIIPDVFVPIDTISGNDFLVKLNRRGSHIRFSIKFADRHRKELQEVASLDELGRLLDSYNLMEKFAEYVRNEEKISFTKEEWAKNEHLLDVQIRAMVGRYSKLDDYAFYPIIAEIDNVIQKALQQKELE